MKTVKYHCDICGKEIIGYMNVCRITITELLVHDREKSELWELCTKCKKDIVKYLKGRRKK